MVGNMAHFGAPIMYAFNYLLRWSRCSLLQILDDTLTPHVRNRYSGAG